MITLFSLRAITSVYAKLCKMKKLTDFTHFDQKNTHISECKIVHKCTIATITVHICTVIVVLHIIILLISQFGSLFSLSSCFETNSEMNSDFSFLPHILTLLLQTNTSQKSITQIQKPQN